MEQISAGEHYLSFRRLRSRVESEMCLFLGRNMEEPHPYYYPSSKTWQSTPANPNYHCSSSRPCIIFYLSHKWHAMVCLKCTARLRVCRIKHCRFQMSFTHPWSACKWGGRSENGPASTQGSTAIVTGYTSSFGGELFWKFGRG